MAANNNLQDDYKVPEGWAKIPFYLKNTLYLPLALLWVSLDATVGATYRTLIKSKSWRKISENTLETVKPFPRTNLSKAALWIRDNYTSKMLSPNAAALSVAIPTYFFFNRHCV